MLNRGEAGKLEPRQLGSYRGRIKVKITSKIKISDKADSKRNVPESQGDDGQDQEHAAGHELFGLGQAQAEDYKEHGHHQVGKGACNARFKQTAGAQDEAGS